MAEKYILTVLGGGPGFTLTDSDMWGIECALQHSIDDGYMKDNAEWAKNMLERVRVLREKSLK